MNRFKEWLLRKWLQEEKILVFVRDFEFGKKAPLDVAYSNLNIDMTLLNNAYRMSGLKTKREAVNIALKEYIENHRQKDILQFFNTVKYDETYDYKKERSR